MAIKQSLKNPESHQYHLAPIFVGAKPALSELVHYQGCTSHAEIESASP